MSDYQVLLVRASEAAGNTRAFCAGLVAAHSGVCRSCSAAAARADALWELAQPTNALLLAVDAGKASLTLPPLHAHELPVCHDHPEQPEGVEGGDDGESGGEESVVLGFLLFDFEDVDMEPEDGFCAYVVEFHVCDSAQRRGVGSALLAQLERLAAQRGASCLRLTCERKNTRAVAFYKARGFRTDPDSPAPRQRASYVILRKRLVR